MVRKKLEFFQSLSIFKYIAVGNAKGGILKNGDILSVHDQDLSRIGATNEIGELLMAFS